MSHHDQQQQQQHQPTRPFLVIGTIPIYFQEDWGAGIGGGLWSTGLAMARYLEDFGGPFGGGSSSSSCSSSCSMMSPVLMHLEQCWRRNQCQPLSLLELGSGNGLLSICWLALLATYNKLHWLKYMVITDHTPQHLDLIQRTLDANQHVFFQSSCQDPSHHHQRQQQNQNDDNNNNNNKFPRIIVLDHPWGVWQPTQGRETTSITTISGTSCYSNNIPHMNHDDDHHHHLDHSVETLIRQGRYQFDLIFGSDLAYHPDLYQPLLDSLDMFSKTNPKDDDSHNNTIILLGCTMRDTTATFFEHARMAGFRYERMAEHYLRPEFRGGIFGIFMFTKETNNQTSNKKENNKK